PGPRCREGRVSVRARAGPAVASACVAWSPAPADRPALTRPFAFALIRRAGADTAMLHAVDAGSMDAMRTGMRVAPRWKAERVGRIDDIEAFVPEPTTPHAAIERSAGGDAAPIEKREFFLTLTYTALMTPTVRRHAAALDAGMS